MESSEDSASTASPSAEDFAPMGDVLCAMPSASMPTARDVTTSYGGVVPSHADREEHAASQEVAAAPVLPASLRALVYDLESADAFTLDARLRRAVKLERLHLSQLGPWLLAVSQKRLFRDLGYHSLDAYAKNELGIASSKARALVRLERLALVSPCFREVWREGALSWTQAEALAPLFELERAERWQPGWLEHAGTVSVRRLRDDVDRAIALEVFEPRACSADPAGLPTGAQPRHWEKGIGAWRSGDEWDALDPTPRATPPTAPHTTPPTTLNPPGNPPGLPTRAQHMDPEGRLPTRLPRHERAQLCFSSPQSVTRIFRAVLATVQRRIEQAENRSSSPSEALDWMLEHVFEAWGRHQPVPARHRIHERDGWRCAVPGCSGYRDLQVHHIVFRSRGGSDSPENLVTMCAWHHLRGIHGLAYHGAVMSCQGTAPRGMRFTLGLRETGPPLAVYRSGDRRVTA